MRIFLGALLAIGPIAAGEWTRRRQSLSELAGFSTANIPSILTGAGTTVAYATVYAAYGLYGLLAPAAAFILLGDTRRARSCLAAAAPLSRRSFGMRARLDEPARSAGGAGRVAEWFKAAVLKTARGRKAPRGFESHPFRRIELQRRQFSERG